jgi:hypothetical protein
VRSRVGATTRPTTLVSRRSAHASTACSPVYEYGRQWPQCSRYPQRRSREQRAKATREYDSRRHSTTALGELSWVRELNRTHWSHAGPHTPQLPTLLTRVRIRAAVAAVQPMTLVSQRRESKSNERVQSATRRHCAGAGARSRGCTNATQRCGLSHAGPHTPPLPAQPCEHTRGGGGSTTRIHSFEVVNKQDGDAHSRCANLPRRNPNPQRSAPSRPRACRPGSYYADRALPNANLATALS